MKMEDETSSPYKLTRVPFPGLAGKLFPTMARLMFVNPLAPELFALVDPLRKLLAGRKGKYAVDIALTLTDQGVDVGAKGLTLDGLAETEALLDFARDQRLARLTLDQGYGPEAMWEPEPVTVSLAGVPVGFPPGAFLQATADGEAALAASRTSWRVIAPLRRATSSTSVTTCSAAFTCVTGPLSVST